MNGCQQGFRSVNSYGFGRQESASKPPQTICKPLCFMRKTLKMKEVVGLAYYEKENWHLLLDSVDDKENMHNTWKEWHEAFLKAKKNLISEGITVENCIIDPLELEIYCKLKGIKNDGKARSLFVSDKISQ